MKEPVIDQSLVQHLVAEQFPQWLSLPITPVVKSGWDNRTFHLGDKLLVRLPSKACYANQVEKEQQWLPKLASNLPLLIPKPIALGQPSNEFPWPWSIYQWIAGEATCLDRVINLSEFSEQLAGFLTALRQCDTTGGPLASADNFYRGGDLTVYDEPTREALAAKITEFTHSNKLTCAEQ